MSTVSQNIQVNRNSSSASTNSTKDSLDKTLTIAQNNTKELVSKQEANRQTHTSNDAELVLNALHGNVPNANTNTEQIDLSSLITLQTPDGDVTVQEYNDILKQYQEISKRNVEILKQGMAQQQQISKNAINDILQVNTYNKAVSTANSLQQDFKNINNVETGLHAIANVIRAERALETDVNSSVKELSASIVDRKIMELMEAQLANYNNTASLLASNSQQLALTQRLIIQGCMGNANRDAATALIEQTLSASVNVMVMKQASSLSKSTALNAIAASTVNSALQKSGIFGDNGTGIGILTQQQAFALISQELNASLSKGINNLANNLVGKIQSGVLNEIGSVTSQIHNQTQNLVSEINRITNSEDFLLIAEIAQLDTGEIGKITGYITEADMMLTQGEKYIQDKIKEHEEKAIKWAEQETQKLVASILKSISIQYGDAISKLIHF